MNTWFPEKEVLSSLPTGTVEQAALRHSEQPQRKAASLDALFIMLLFISKCNVTKFVDFACFTSSQANMYKFSAYLFPFLPDLQCLLLLLTFCLLRHR